MSSIMNGRRCIIFSIINSKSMRTYLMNRFILNYKMYIVTRYLYHKNIFVMKIYLCNHIQFEFESKYFDYITTLEVLIPYENVFINV